MSNADILFVEDSVDDAELTLRTLRRNGVKVSIDHVRDGDEALEYLGLDGGTARAGSQPRLILLDLKLPKVRGIDVLRALRAHERTRATPVVILTSSRESRDLKECYALGVNSYVVKPVEFEAFVEAVRNIGVYWLTINENPPSR